MPAIEIGKPFERDRPEDYVCTTWFERDRKHVRLETPRGRLVFELWDEEVDDAIESGYLSPPRVPRPSDRDWLPSAVFYAVEMGLVGVEKERSTRQPRERAR